MTSLVWMRRDLRLHDHAALATALQGTEDVQPVFIFDSDILSRFSNPQDRRLTFIAETLCHINAQLRKRGGGLLVCHGKATEIIPALAKVLNISSVFSSEDFEPGTRQRDAAVKEALTGSARFVQVLDHLMIAPPELLKGDGTPYRMFTPYYKIWRARIGPAERAEYTVKDKDRYAECNKNKAAANKAGITVLSVEDGPETLLKQIGYRYKRDELWTVDDAQERLQTFIARRLNAYPTARDELDKTGTSQLSPYLRHGLISIREAMNAAVEVGSASGEKWISELGWREFYAMIMYHFPEVVEHEFMPQYRDGALPWSYDKAHIKAFQTGMTGYPVVDAAVRELLTTGYMHNRARMIVCSFVTKDLLLDWRIGEEFFAQYLMDYELASNNGGWQWGASTGTDAAPYFRVFNPILQSKKFDPNGDYIRAYVPELRRADKRDIHAPWLSPLTKPKEYPMPIVDHAKAKERVIRLFKEAGNKKY